MEVFRKVTMKAPTENGIVTPSASGEKEQFISAAVADALREGEEDDATKPEKERQRQFFKNGIAKIGTTDYFAHTERENGQSVTVYKTTKPEVVTAAAPAAAQPFDAASLGAAIAQGLRAAATETQPTEPTAKSTKKVASGEAEKVKATAAANTAAAASAQGAAQPDAAAGTDAANSDQK